MASSLTVRRPLALTPSTGSGSNQITKQALQARLQSAYSKIRNLQNSTEQAVEETAGVFTVIAGGGAAGVMRGFRGGMELFGIPLGTAVGATLSLLGISKLAGRGSSHLVNFGSGMLASEAGSALEDFTRRRTLSTPKPKPQGQAQTAPR